MKEVKKLPSTFESIVPILFLIGLLALNVYIFGDSASYGPNQIALLFAASIAAVMALRLGFNWDDVVEGMVKSISSAMSAILILLMIGSLAGTWMLGGIVPAMIYYGLDLISPSLFLIAACLVSAIVSLATGSSWSTTATIGVAMIGIGRAMEIPDGLIAGAVISGAYFGDKMSPLSDTTNLAPAMAGTDLFTHIRYMVYTTAPSFIITLIIFFIWGFTLEKAGDLESIGVTQALISSKFTITPWLFLVPAAVIIFIVKKMPALPAIFIGTLLGGVFALIFQPGIIEDIGGSYDLKGSYTAILTSMFTKLEIITGNAGVDKLLTAKGMEGMLSTIWLILCAMIFGGVMEMAGMLSVIAQYIIKLAKTTGSLIFSTATTCLLFNITASDQYIAIVVPGRI
ncbi:MAG: sodium:proton antiporter, partial [Cyclobacteriaceae bacterium]|nr:sodium:proton antiporter [Cyclobacteriaceae bacterium]